MEFSTRKIELGSYVKNKLDYLEEKYEEKTYGQYFKVPYVMFIIAIAAIPKISVKIF